MNDRHKRCRIKDKLNRNIFRQYKPADGRPFSLNLLSINLISLSNKNKYIFTKKKLKLRLEWRDVLKYLKRYMMIILVNEEIKELEILVQNG